MKENNNVLIVSEDPIITMSTERVLRTEGYTVEGVQGTKEAKHRIKHTHYDLVVTDLAVLGSGGISLIQWTTRYRPATGIVVITGVLVQETIQEALKTFTDTRTVSPVIPQSLKDAIRMTTEWIGGNALDNGQDEDFPPAKLAELDKVICQYREVPNGAIPVMLCAREIFGYLSPGIQQRIAKGLNIYPSEISGIASFYSCFRTKPRGDHTIKVCRGSSCHMKGSEEILNGIREMLKIGVGGTTGNREFTLEDVHCVGACKVAPVLVIDRETYGGVNRRKAIKLITGMHRKRVGGTGRGRSSAFRALRHEQREDGKKVTEKQCVDWR